MKILVTGASGFIGSFVVSEGLAKGYEMWAGIRATSSRQYLQDERIHFAELDLNTPLVLQQQLRTLKEEMGGWDYIIHAAGVTKCRHREEFFQTNTKGTQYLVDALIAEDMVPRRFIFISSLSVFGAIREEPVKERRLSAKAVRPGEKVISEHHYAPILPTDQPHPNTAYGESKLLAERILQGKKNFPIVILRPTGVYGPREKDYLLMAQSIRQHVDFAVGFAPQEITFIYVQDLVSAIYLSLTAKDAIGKAYFLSDGGVYNSRQFSDLLQQTLGVGWVLHITSPLWMLRIVCAVVGTVSGWLGKTSTLNLDKYHILSQRNWQCDIQPATQDLGYHPEWTLERGVKATFGKGE